MLHWAYRWEPLRCEQTCTWKREDSHWRVSSVSHEQQQSRAQTRQSSLPQFEVESFACSPVVTFSVRGIPWWRVHDCSPEGQRFLSSLVTFLAFSMGGGQMFFVFYMVRVSVLSLLLMKASPCGAGGQEQHKHLNLKSQNLCFHNLIADCIRPDLLSGCLWLSLETRVCGFLSQCKPQDCSVYVFAPYPSKVGMPLALRAMMMLL